MKLQQFKSKGKTDEKKNTNKHDTSISNFPIIKKTCRNAKLRKKKSVKAKRTENMLLL